MEIWNGLIVQFESLIIINFFLREKKRVSVFAFVVKEV